MTTDPSSNPAGSDATGDAAASAGAPQKTAPDEGGVKETLESILIAFILAFIFRAFVVEAYVIPTGSMAPTLLGAHMRFTCTDCGYRFEANYSSPDDRGGSDVYIPALAQGATFTTHCPNCGLQVPKRLDPNAPAAAANATADDDDERPRRGDPDNAASSPPVHYGDRILVLKYVYELLRPQRWDVVVFKTPDANSTPLYTVNYIKRLIGRPNESVMILDGDIYVKAPGSEEWVVQTKPRVAQEALWRIVYDNDFLPHRSDFVQPWKPADSASGWSVGTPQARSRELAFDRLDRGTSWLTFSPDPDQANQPLKDWLAYADTRDQRGGTGYGRALTAENNVSDLKLQFFYERQRGTGPLRLELRKIDDTFTAEIGPDGVRLLHRVNAEADKELFPVVELPSQSGAMRIEFANADYQVTLRINGKEYFRTTPQQYAPDLSLLRRYYDDGFRPLPPPQVRIGGEAQACTLSHVSLWRDVYYVNHDPRGGVYEPQFGTPAKPIKLGPKEYWVLGDNSLMSGDARFWSSPISLPREDLNAQAARVPERFLIGKAFFAYWPAGYRLTTSGPGFIPNFGEMRFIH
jgi:signal peptidase I